MGYHTASRDPQLLDLCARTSSCRTTCSSPRRGGWSLVSHLYMVSGWSAQCSNGRDPFTCVADNRFRGCDPQFSKLPGPVQNTTGEDLVGGVSGLVAPSTTVQPPQYAWTDVTYLLHRYGVSWRYYIQQGTEPDCETGAMTCTPVAQAVTTPSIWNPLPEFSDVRRLELLLWQARADHHAPRHGAVSRHPSRPSARNEIATRCANPLAQARGQALAGHQPKRGGELPPAAETFRVHHDSATALAVIGP